MEREAKMRTDVKFLKFTYWKIIFAFAITLEYQFIRIYVYNISINLISIVLFLIFSYTVSSLIIEAINKKYEKSIKIYLISLLVLLVSVFLLHLLLRILIGQTKIGLFF